MAKGSLKMPKIFRKPEICGQIVLLDRSLFIEQKLVENAKIKRFNCDMFNYFHCLKALPDRLLLKGQKLVENAKIETFKYDIFQSNFHSKTALPRIKDATF